MKKWLGLALLALVLVLLAVPAMAKSSSSKLAELEALYQELALVREKITDIRAEMGLITPEQKTIIKERIKQHHEWMREHCYHDPGCPFGPGIQRRHGHGYHGWGNWEWQ